MLRRLELSVQTVVVVLVLSVLVCSTDSVTSSVACLAEGLGGCGCGMYTFSGEAWCVRMGGGGGGGSDILEEYVN